VAQGAAGEGEAGVAADPFALAGVHPRTVPQSVLLEALLHQVGHYVCEGVYALKERMGVESREGHRVVVSGDATAMHALMPPGTSARVVEGRTAFFWPVWGGYDRNKPPWAGRVDPSDAAILAPIARALTHFVEFDDAGAGWVSLLSYGDDRDALSREPARLARLFSLGGAPSAVVALIAGRLIDGAYPPVEVEPTIWMFDRAPSR